MDFIFPRKGSQRFGPTSKGCLLQRMLPADDKTAVWMFGKPGDIHLLFFFFFCDVCLDVIFHNDYQECNRVNKKVSLTRQANIFLVCNIYNLTTVQEHKSYEQCSSSCKYYSTSAKPGKT